jgi:hypothetical protein
VGEPAHRFHEGAERAPLRVRPFLAEPGDPQHHQPRVDVEQRVGPETPLLHDARPEVLDDHVRVGDELAQQLLPLRAAEVQGDRALVAGDHLPPQAVALAVPAVRAGRVAVRVLDLEHVGAHVAQQHRSDRCGVDRADVEDLDPVERAASPGRVGRSLQFVHPLTPSSPVA